MSIYSYTYMYIAGFSSCGLLQSYNCCGDRQLSDMGTRLKALWGYECFCHDLPTNIGSNGCGLSAKPDICYCGWDVQDIVKSSLTCD